MSYHQLLLDALSRMRLRISPGLGRAYEKPTAACVPFDITPLLPLIDDFFHKHARGNGSGVTSVTADDLPDVVIPYKETWWEWRETAAAGTRMGSRMTPPHKQEGSMILACHVRVFDSGQLADLLELRRREDPRDGPVDAKLGKLFNLGRWTIELTLYATENREMKPGGAVVVVQRAVTILGADGRVKMQVFNAGEGLVSPDDLPVKERGYSGLFAGVLFAMALLGCKNVEQEHVDAPTALSRKRVRRGGLPLVRYHRLRVRVPGKKRYVDADEVRRAQESPVPVGLHYVRGHMKTYTPEKPLLGRAVGKWYWPPHLAGSIKGGVIAKTYVEEPAPHDTLMEKR